MRSAMPQFDSIQGYEQAKDERFWEGTELGVCGYRSGSVYLLGYSVEITLKSAFFRFIRHPIHAAIGKTDLKKAELLAGTLGVAHLPESWHSILFWCDVLRHHRRQTGRPLDAVLEAELVHQAQSAYDRWWVDMRYKSGLTTKSVDVEEVARAADWCDRNYDKLWK